MHNCLPDTFFEELTQKLAASKLPDNQIQSYVDHYREFQNYGVSDIDLFENHEMPSDDCFRTLTEAQRIFAVNNYSEYANELDLVGKYLRTPYCNVIAAKEAMIRVFEQSGVEVDIAYNQSPEWLFITNESVYAYAALLKDRFPDLDFVWRIFKKAALLGVEKTKQRIDLVLNNLGLENGEKVIRNDLQGEGWLFYPWFTDPVGCIEYMAQCGLTSEAIVDLLEKEPRLLFEYKEGCKSKYHHDQQYIDAVINKYLSTMR